MLYPIYAAIKTKAETISDLTGGAQWYALQYESTIEQSPVLFIEFPDLLKFDKLSKQLSEKDSSFRVRLHLAQSSITKTNGRIDDAILQAHNALAVEIKENIDLLEINDGGSRYARRLELSGWQHWHAHQYKGWLVTFIEFETHIVQ